MFELHFYDKKKNRIASTTLDHTFVDDALAALDIAAATKLQDLEEVHLCTNIGGSSQWISGRCNISGKLDAMSLDKQALLENARQTVYKKEREDLAAQEAKEAEEKKAMLEAESAKKDS